MENIPVHVTRIHANIFSMNIDDENIGYLVNNEVGEDQKSKTTVVKSNGENMGDYCCMSHATKAAVKAHFNFDEDHLLIDSKDPINALKMLLLASILSDVTRH